MRGKYYIPSGNYKLRQYTQVRSSLTSRYWKLDGDEREEIVDNNYVSNVMNSSNPFSGREWRTWHTHDGKLISYSPSGLYRQVFEFYYTLEEA